MNSPKQPSTSFLLGGSRAIFAHPLVLGTLVTLISVSLYASGLFSLFSGLPLFFYAFRWGMSWAFYPFLSVILVLGGMSPMDGVFWVLTLGSASWAAGGWLGKHQKFADAIFAGSVVSVALVTLTIVVGIKGFEVHKQIPTVRSVYQQVESNIETFYVELDRATQESRQTPLTQEELQQNRQNFMKWSLGLMPAGLIAISSISLWIYVILLRPWFRRRNQGHLYQALYHWRSPEGLVWVAIFMLSLLIFTQAPIKMWAANGVVILATLYLFQGVAILVHFLNTRNISAGWRFMVYALTFLFLKYVVMTLVTVGFLDLWFDFRKDKKVGTA